MPEALARADHDYVLREDARPTRARRAAQAPEPSRFAFVGKLLRGRTLLVGCAGLLLLGIGVNALFLQNARHPAPFFRAKDQPAAAEQAQANVPVPPARPAEVAAKPPVRPAAPPASLPAERVASAPETRPAAGTREAPRDAARQNLSAPALPAAKPEPKSDAIAALLREGRPSTQSPPAAIPNPTAEQTKRVVAVQEALKKLGHGVTPDGVAGPSTRAAIEQFERAQKLPVSGQMSPRVMKELASRSGVRIP